MYKTLIAALIVASAAVSLSTKASAGPGAQAPAAHESLYQYRASQNHDNGGN